MDSATYGVMLMSKRSRKRVRKIATRVEIVSSGFQEKGSLEMICKRRTRIRWKSTVTAALLSKCWRETMDERTLRDIDTPQRLSQKIRRSGIVPREERVNNCAARAGSG